MTDFNGLCRPPLTRRYTRSDYLVLSALLALFLVAFWEVFFGGRVFFFRDFALFFYPRRWFVAEALQHARIPFWNPYSACGEPVLGAYQSAVFYPPALLYYLLPMPASFMWFVAFHYLTSGAGAYHMMRVFGARRPAATLAAVAWAFSPPFIGAVDQVSFQTSLAWLPWCLAFARRISSGLFLRGFLGLSVSFALVVLAGAPEPVIFVAAVTAAFAVWQCLAARRVAAGARCAAAALMLGALAAGVLVSGVEVVPFLHALRYSARHAALPVEEAGKWSAAPGDALILFLPRFNLFADRGGIYWRGQQFWLKTVYLGAFIPLMALWSVVFVRRRRNWFFVILALLFVLMAAGPYSPLWRLGYAHVPGVSQIRYPIKFLLPAAFAFAVLAGFALDDAIVLARRLRVLRLAALLAMIAAPALLFALLWHLADRSPATMLPRLTPPDWMGFGEPWKRHFQECYESTVWSLGRSAAFLAVGAAALLVTLGLAARRVARPYGVMILVAILFADVAFYSAHLNPLIGPETYTEDPGRIALVPKGNYESRVLMTGPLRRKLLNIRVAEIDRLGDLRAFLSLAKGANLNNNDLLAYLKRTSAAPYCVSAARLERWLVDTSSALLRTQLEYEFYKETFYPNANMFCRVPAVDGFDPMAVKWHNELMAKLIDAKFPAERLPMLARLWGASVLIDAAEGAPGFVYAPVSPPGRRAALVSRVVAAEDDARALSLVSEGSDDLTRSVVLAAADAREAAEHLGPDALTSTGGEADLGSVLLTSDDGNSSSYSVAAGKNCLLFIADTFFPNFAATVDGKPAPLWRANYAYRAVPVPAGEHVVRFAWRPYDFQLGLVVTLVGLLVLTLVAFLCHRRQACRRRDTSDA